MEPEVALKIYEHGQKYAYLQPIEDWSMIALSAFLFISTVYLMFKDWKDNHKPT
jgi:hypothetical protein